MTGAAGNIGRTLVAGLTELGHEVRGVDRTTSDPPWSDKIITADIATDDDALDAVLAGADAVVHLAAIAGETDFETALDTHVRLTHRVLEHARTAGVRRFVYASSNHAVGFTPRTGLLTTGTRPRPDTYYGLGKVASEAVCSLFHDRFGIEVACLRIGSFRHRPDSRRALSTWLSPGDAVRLVEACLTAPDLGFAVMYGVSANTRGWWDLAPALALGYRPQDDAEQWATEIEATPEAADFGVDPGLVGGDFTASSSDADPLGFANRTFRTA